MSLKSSSLLSRLFVTGISQSPRNTREVAASGMTRGAAGTRGGSDAAEPSVIDISHDRELVCWPNCDCDTERISDPGADADDLTLTTVLLLEAVGLLSLLLILSAVTTATAVAVAWEAMCDFVVCDEAMTFLQSNVHWEMEFEGRTVEWMLVDDAEQQLLL